MTISHNCNCISPHYAIISENMTLYITTTELSLTIATSYLIIQISLTILVVILQYDLILSQRYSSQYCLSQFLSNISLYSFLTILTSYVTI